MRGGENMPSMIGQSVTFVDSRRNARPALVIADHGQASVQQADGTFQGYEAPDAERSLNLIYVDPNEGAEDSYGRQTCKVTSIVHESCQPAEGFFWRR
jgi:hypothetical protein